MIFMDVSLETTAAFDRAVAPVLGVLSREQALEIASFHADAKLQSRIEVLAQKANEGELTADEQAEYEGYAQANRFLAVLQAEARRVAEAPDST